MSVVFTQRPRGSALALALASIQTFYQLLKHLDYYLLTLYTFSILTHSTQLVNLDDSADDDVNTSDNESQHIDTREMHTHTTTIADDTHRRGHAPSAQQLGRTMPTRSNNGGGEIWDGSEYYMDI